MSERIHKRKSGIAAPSIAPTEQQRAIAETRERREAEPAALLREVRVTQAQRDTAVSALELIAADVDSPATASSSQLRGIEKAMRGIAASALRRVQFLEARKSAQSKELT